MRRSQITAIVMALLVGLIAGCTYPVTYPAIATPSAEQTQQAQEVEALRQEVARLDRIITRLSYNTASGGGINLKMMPNPETGEPTVPLEEVFAFDRNYALCRVDTNPEAFVMPTYQLGDLLIEPHQFFMFMITTSVDQYEVITEPDGTRRVRMRGGLNCATEIGQAQVRIGSRTAFEHATYLIEAVDRGIGGGEAGDTFAFTVFFDPEEAPINYAIFGPEFTFTGKMIAGEITIVDPRFPLGQ